jgi:hypothetical protein
MRSSRALKKLNIGFSIFLFYTALPLLRLFNRFKFVFNFLWNKFGNRFFKVFVFILKSRFLQNKFPCFFL